eukprot:scaffold115_cov172-Amphora_coffeaeformis.AAC.2
MSTEKIPAETCSPFGSYPNPFGLTTEDRATFHPVVKFPVTPTVFDFTKPSPTTVGMATEEQRQAVAAGERLEDVLPPDLCKRVQAISSSYAIGRYDEPRAGLYESDLFDDTANSIENYTGRRNLHVAIDLGGPVGTPVYAFAPGRVHAVGYNAALGDYGNVIVVAHELPNSNKRATSTSICYALYGHLDSTVVQNFRVGDAVSGGQVLGGMGAIHENGGWWAPHVHFQLATQPPVTHDLPGAVAAADRARALLEYPDPRWVLGELY